MPRSKAPRPAPEPESVEPAEPAVGDLGARIRDMRTARKWSLDALANASDVSRSMLSQIERNEANPTLAVTMRIARAFGITLGELVESPDATSAVQVIRAGDRAQIYRSDKDCQIRTLSPLQLEKDVEFYEVALQPGGVLRSAPHFSGTREFLVVEKGKVRVESGRDSEELERGDSATYRADVPHAIVNLGKTEAMVFLVDIYR
jgi:transcriptional regulator with XRE-family HTH domain